MDSVGVCQFPRSSLCQSQLRLLSTACNPLNCIRNSRRAVSILLRSIPCFHNSLIMDHRHLFTAPLFVPSLLQLILLIGVGSVEAVENGNTRVISIVEQFDGDTLWEFHSKSVRRAQVSKRTWDEYIKYKEQTCRLEMEEDRESKAKGYLSWEEMAFHKSLRLKLLPNSAAHDALSYEDAVMLSNVDSRLLSPEPESLCRLGVIDDSDQNEIAEKSRFEDTLISRLFRKEIRESEQGNSEH